MNKKRILTVLTTFCLLIALSLGMTGCLFNSEKRFGTFTDELFVGMFAGDGFSVNFLFENPENYGLENETATISVPSTKDEYESSFSALALQSKILKLRFRYNQLTNEQKVLYDYLVYFFNLRSEYKDYYYLQDDFIGSYLGFQASLPIYLAEYNFKSKTDVDNYINLINETATAFPAYFAYEQDRVNNKYGRADFVYEGAVEQCENFTGVQCEGDFALPAEENFLIGIFNDRINSCEFLTAEEKAAYITLNVTKINEVLLPSYYTLGKNVATLIGNANNNQLGMSHYEGGQAYYSLLFKSATGTSDSVATAKEKLTAEYNETVTEYMNVYYGIIADEGISFDVEAALTAWEASDDWTTAGLTATLGGLQTDIAADFPAIAEMGAIVLKTVPESLKDNYSPAAYFTSHLDSKTADHVIMINSYDTSGYISYDLLSHEGFPGHLYQDAYFKNNNVNKLMMVLGQTGYKEGWAVYVESYCTKYYQPDTLNNKLYQLYILNNKINQLRVSLMDVWVNYDGYTREQLLLEVNNTFKYYFATGSEDYVMLEDYCNRVFEHIVEVPTNVLQYYYSALKVEELKAEYKTKLGDGYTDLAFHTAFMQYGALPIEMYHSILI